MPRKKKPKAVVSVLKFRFYGGGVTENALEVDVDEQSDTETEIGIAPEPLSVTPQELRETSGTPRVRGLPRLMLLSGYLLTPRLRNAVFLPAFNNHLDEYVKARLKFRGKWERRYLSLTFGYHTAKLISECIFQEVDGKSLRRIGVAAGSLISIAITIWKLCLS